MPNPFKKWFCKRESEQIPPPMPTLPEVRGRPLTSTACSPSATANSALFQLIPAEIRRIILFEAFGGRTLHYELRLLPPAKKKPALRIGAYPTHANLVPEYDWSKLPLQWKWLGCVCHNGYPRPWLSLPGSDPKARMREKCCHGFNLYCDRWPGEVPFKCLVGAMAWIVVCWQAYIEGIEVLYRLNWLSIRGTDLTRRLPGLMLLQRRTAIRAVELYWDLCPWREDTISPLSDMIAPKSSMDDFKSTLKDLPTILPNLTHLHLSLQGYVKRHLEINAPIPPVSELDKITLEDSETLLQLVDQMVIKLPQLRVCQVAMGSSQFRAQKFKQQGVGVLVPEGLMPESGKLEPPLWRRLPVQPPVSQQQREERISPVITGYWISMGELGGIHPDDDPGDIFYTVCGL
ncbi:hypothetical protein FQN49_003569 [Arthroderma sp. PD_2]|nr:hypothetical protein FQN49_003569 [Arthroderma sp. PD_2]